MVLFFFEILVNKKNDNDSNKSIKINAFKNCKINLLLLVVMPS